MKCDIALCYHLRLNVTGVQVSAVNNCAVSIPVSVNKYEYDV